MKFACGHDNEKDTLKVLIISHIVSGVISVLYELSSHMGWYTTQAFCEILRIPTYFYVFMYAFHEGIEMLRATDPSCIDGKIPIYEILIMIELGCFGFWVFSTPLFMTCAKLLGY